MNKEIIVLMLSIGIGGAERVLTLLMNEWIKYGYSITILLRDPLVENHDYVTDERIRIVELNNAGKTKYEKRLHCAIDLCRYLNAHRDATVLTFSNPMIRLLGIIMPFVHNRIVFSERCDPYHSPKSRVLRRVRRYLFRKADVCVFQTEEAKQYFSKSVQSKGIVIPNPINPDLPSPYKGIRDKRIVAACQLIPQKNVPLLLRAFSKLHSDHPDYDLYVYGRGPLKDDFVSLSQELGIEKNVYFPGFAKNINEVINSAAMFVSSSNYEGISNSMLEALGMGVPSVCTDCPIGGARQMIKNGVNGILVPIGDVDALYGSMKRIIEEPGLAESLSMEARKIREEYPVERIAKEWLELL